MYVTRPLSSYKRSPENLALPPPEGPNSGFFGSFWWGMRDYYLLWIVQEQVGPAPAFPSEQGSNGLVHRTPPRDQYNYLLRRSFYSCTWSTFVFQSVLCYSATKGSVKGMHTYFGICNFYIFSDLLDQIIIILRIKIANDMTMTVVYNVYRSSTLFFVSML